MTSSLTYFPHLTPPPPPPHKITPPPPPAPIFPPPPPSSPDNGPTVIIIVFISFGCLLFIAFLAMALCCCIIKKKKEEKQETDIIRMDEHLKVKEAAAEAGSHGGEAVVLEIEDDIHFEEVKQKNEKFGAGLNVEPQDKIHVADAEEGLTSTSTSSSHHHHHNLKHKA